MTPEPRRRRPPPLASCPWLRVQEAPLLPADGQKAVPLQGTRHGQLGPPLLPLLQALLPAVGPAPWALAGSPASASAAHTTMGGSCSRVFENISIG